MFYFSFFSLSELCLISSFFALTWQRSCLQNLVLLLGFLHPSHPQGHTDHFNMVNKNPSFPVLHVFFPRVLEHIFMSIQTDPLVPLSLRFCSGLPGSFLAAHEMAQQTFSVLKFHTGWALGRGISGQLLTPWLTGGVRIRSQSQRLFPVSSAPLCLIVSPSQFVQAEFFVLLRFGGGSSYSSQPLGISPSQAWDGTHGISAFWLLTPFFSLFSKDHSLLLPL